jgi:hypothetical protein
MRAATGSRSRWRSTTPTAPWRSTRTRSPPRCPLQPGSPHQGAPLEQVVHLAAGLLRWIPHPTTRVPADVINARSAGVKDLRFGYTRDDDWTGHDPDAVLHNKRQPVPLLPHATHYRRGQPHA